MAYGTALVSATRKKTLARESPDRRASITSATPRPRSCHSSCISASKAVTAAGRSMPSIADIMTRMRRVSPGSLRACAAGSVLIACCLAPIDARQGRSVPLAPQDLAQIWDAEHLSPPLPPLIEHAEVERRLAAASASDPNRFILERAGESLEGRAINMITVGTGPFRVLLWSQMHGDEPTATAALFDVLDYFQRHRTDPAVQRILSALTLHIVPCLLYTSPSPRD